MMDLPKLFKPKFHYFGLSIDRTSLRATEIDTKGDVYSSAEVLFSEEPLEKGVLKDPQTFIAGLKKLKEIGKFTTPFVSVCFPETYALTRGLTIPKIDRHEIPEAVAWQVKDLFPFPEHELYFDWRIIEETEDEYHLAVVSIQKHTLNAIIEALAEVGLRPVRFESGASIIARLLVLPVDQFTLVSDINTHGASVTLVRGEKTIFTTIINNIANESEDAYVAHIAATVSDVIAYYKKKFPLDDTNLSIIVTGEKATEDWIRAKRHVFPYPIKLLATRIDNPAFNKSYAMAALDLSPPDDSNTINLLPQDLQSRYEVEQKGMLFGDIIGRINQSVFALTIVLVLGIGCAMLALYRLQRSISTIGHGSPEDRTRVVSMREIETHAKDIMLLAPLRKTPKDVIAAWQRLLPESVQMSQWEYDDAKLLFTLHGIAQTREALVEFKNALEASKDFANVTFPLDSLESSMSAAFTISFVVQ